MRKLFQAPATLKHSNYSHACNCCTKNCFAHHW